MMFKMIKTFSPECNLVLPFDFSCSKMSLNKIDWIDVLETSVFREAIDSALHTPNCIGQQEPRKMILKSTRKHQNELLLQKLSFWLFLFLFLKRKVAKSNASQQTRKQKKIPLLWPELRSFGWESKKLTTFILAKKKVIFCFLNFRWKLTSQI